MNQRYTPCMHVVWFKRDLRIHDHIPLSLATLAGPTFPVYILEPDLWNEPDMSTRQFLFLSDCIIELQRDLGAIGLDLKIMVGNATDCLNTLNNTIGITHLWSSQETWNGWTYDRDLAVKEWTRENHIEWTESPQHGVIRCLKNRDGWSYLWKKRMSAPMVTATPVGAPISPTAHFPPPEDIGLTPDGIIDLQKGGSSAALDCLNQFLFDSGQPYTKAMSSPVTAFNACSRLSPHLAFGTISIRHVFQIANKRQQAIKTMPRGPEKKEWQSALRSFLGRLRWHCHFIQKLEDEPQLEFLSLHPMMRDLDTQSFSPSFFEKWKTGNTGFPLVDACMRALRATGWLNFRMRAMVMSVAVHHLQLPWRHCALYLATQFVDYEPGIHYSQCQMQAGRTGINAIRIYNPIKQGLDQDPTGVFIRQWLPELSKIPDRGIHHPWAFGHPQPIVDEASTRQQAATLLYGRKKHPSFKKSSEKILNKHGSRRKRVTSPLQMQLDLA